MAYVTGSYEALRERDDPRTLDASIRSSQMAAAVSRCAACGYRRGARVVGDGWGEVKYSNRQAILISSVGKFAIWEHGHCHNLHCLPVDEELELWPCQGSDSCSAMVCTACGGTDEDKCGLCGLHACSDHMKLNYDAGEGNGGVYVRICDICIVKLKEPPEPDGIRCSSCGQYSSQVPGDGRYYAERDDSTGYSDSGWMCQQCVDFKPELTTVVTAENEDESCPW